MTRALPLRRHVSISVDSTTIDVAGGPDHTIAGAISALGIPFDTERFAVIGSDGAVIASSTPLAEIPDGARVSVVDRSHVVGRSAGSGSERVDHAALWWMLAATGAVLALAQIALLATSAERSRPAIVAAVVGLGALAAAFAVARVATRNAPIALTGAALLAFAAGAAMAPDSTRALALGVIFGLVATAVVMTALVAVARNVTIRTTAATVATIAVVFATLWALALYADWPMTTASAISVGLVAPGLKVLPATMLNVPEGYSISYRHFMSQRWSVRGDVPADPGPIALDVVTPMLAQSRARLVAGTASLSAAAVLFTPGMLPAIAADSAIVSWSALVALGSTVTVLALLPRTAPIAALRWLPRSAATIMLIEIGLFAAHDAGLPLRTAGIAGALVVALLAGALIVPLGRGTRSLFWSRLTDVAERIAAVIALPAALLAADMLELVRTAMAG